MIEEQLKAISIALEDLIYLSKKNTDSKLFDELFYNRDNDLNKFKSYLECIDKTSNNILIQGEAGIGKTCFVYKLSHDEKLTSENNIYPIVIDYSSISPRSVNSALSYFLREIERYFKEMGHHCNGFKEFREENINMNYNTLTNHLRDYEDIKLRKHCLVFIDDIDYAEDDWYELLKYIMPLSTSPLISIVLTVRPHLYAALESYDDRTAIFFARNAQQINLEPLSVENIISSRLAPLLIENNDKKLHRFMNSLFSRTSRLSKILTAYGIKNLDDLDRIQYPFTEKHNNFMARITNGNIREIFDITYDSISYILRNKDLETRIEDGFNKKVIGKKGVMSIFYENDKSKFKLININVHVNKNGNSRYFNVLEAVKLHKIINEAFYKSLSQMGHSKKDVDQAIEELGLKYNRLIKPKKYIPLSRRSSACHEYELTEKGNYYLEIAEWPEYTARCGKYGKSLRETIIDIYKRKH